ncbi:ABC transporter substrate-binding protein [Paenibacillus radicis (ex Gao et al. 2016)]|uniref:ABC transporter substrate-binding protein n=2 Tax=Paenibacillus radicis (ex Gao et al. 2016) TaxID=1737354 RepID=A0A917LRJ0_9BACL|nr:ABC transporter substrate-binding protein [Paenibacillus radicis (ex Gao et al. 2016)]
MFVNMPKVLRVAVALLLLCTWVIPSAGPHLASAEESVKAERADGNVFQANSYDSYLQTHQNAARPDRNIVVQGGSYTFAEGMEPKKVNDAGDRQGNFVETGDSGSIGWDVTIPEDGLYNLSLRYFTVDGKASSIERMLMIDGEVPFSGARSFLFPRIWTDEKAMEQDNRGNDIRPRQVETFGWQEKPFRDFEGYYEKPYSFYFSAGKHTITLVSLKEPVIIDAIEIGQIEEPPTYEEIKKQYEQQGLKETSGQTIKVQGESAQFKSSPTLYPITDRSNPNTEPQSVSEVRINTIGGHNWRMPGDTITWKIDVPEDGLYKIAIKGRQELLRGVYSTRTLRIDDHIPFQEMREIPFYYSSEWQMNTIGNGEEPYLFYLTKGTHDLQLEVSLGSIAPLIREVQSSILELNAIYRKILMITGGVPDPFRDYNLEKKVPEMVEVFNKQSDILYKISDQLVEITGEKSDQIAILTKLAYQLKDLAANPESLQTRLESFKINVGGLGTWILQVKEQPLEIDYLVIASPEQRMPKAKASFAKKMKHEISTLLSSFFIDYNSIGNSSESERSVTVWIGTGRDQAQVLKAMSDDSFTQQTGISVNLKLVSANVLMPATLSGQGPDVAMQISNDIPVNYGMRTAIYDLTQFSDFEQVADRFRDSALTPYKYKDAVFGLPEQQVFPMLFYRKDILEELKLDVPQTLEDIYEVIPVLKKHYMDFALPIAETSGVSTLEPSKAFAMMLYQQDGTFYEKDGNSNLDSEASMQAFKRWTDLYMNYKLPLQFDLTTRFRTGEIPMAITDYTFYNTLSVSAPEIRGLWDFVAVPGIQQEDGSIRRDVSSGGSAVIMMDQAKDKDAAWEFMKWWTSKDTQVRFGREMEGLMGAAARYPTANIEALKELPWPTKDYQSLEKQWEWVKGIPEVPGGYYTGRNLDNAFREVINNGTNPRDALYDYVEEINREIDFKQKEFNLKQS